jgi:periplasmic divalent cation tolerance protein
MNDDATTVVMVYMTAPTMAEAELLAEAMITRRVAACVNILGAIQSRYEWKGVLEKSEEVALVAKTTKAQFAALETTVKELHSYECPCIVAWPLSDGHAPFLMWVRQAVK